jgi:Tfp pilus assembly protein PilX
MRNEKGIAMVLAVSLIGLLTSLAVYLMAESGTSYRITKAMNRYESCFNLAEAGLQLGLRCVRRSAPSPSYQHQHDAVIPG